MKQSKIFHTLYLAVMALPLFLMGVFAIYSQNHEINDNTLQVQENLKVNFNQKLNDGHFEENIDGWSTGQIYSINDNELLLTANGTSAYPQISHTFNF